MARRLEATTHSVRVGGLHIYLITHEKEDGGLDFISLHSAKMGSTLHGLFSTIEQLVNLALRHGATPAEVGEVLLELVFEPNGMTDDPDVPSASSVADYLGQKLRKTYPDPAQMPQEASA